MISAIFLRHYKVYKNINYIPLIDEDLSKLSVYIGNNGVGKSSILQALDTFFNNFDWVLSKNGKKSEAFIAPVLLIEKTKLEEFASEDVYSLLEKISEYFWTASSEINQNLKKPQFDPFFEHRNKLSEKGLSDTHLLLLFGISYNDRNNPFFITFDNDIETKIPGVKSPDLLKVIRNYFSYIYIPSETITSELLRIETDEMQALMDDDILLKIDSILTQSETGKKSLVRTINDELNSYMDSINEIIQEIDTGYAFKTESSYKKNLTAKDVRGKILEAYFTIRSLKKNSKEIRDLSSGEQRLALIDIATAFLKKSDIRKSRVIFAIDEPETSLHISKMFEQFNKISELSLYNQVLITTHWYGSLPIIQNGSLHYIDGENKIYSYSFKNYFEDRGNFPDDVLIKSFYELSSSIISSMRMENTNWIICEGSDDKNYLEFYLKSKIPNLRVFPLGGCGNVVKIYKHLYVPLSDKESNSISGKILCLIDTDEERTKLDYPDETKKRNIAIRRIQIYEDGKTELCRIDHPGRYLYTEIEDCLNPGSFFEVLIDVVDSDLIDDFEYCDIGGASRIKGEVSILKPKSIDAFSNKSDIYALFEENSFKYGFANKYTEVANCEEMPALFSKIKEYFYVS